MAAKEWRCQRLRTLRDWWDGGSANRLDWALEVAGGLELQLVGHRMDLETVEPGHKLVGGPFGPVLRVYHEKHVREASAEVGAVRVVVPR